MDKIYFLAIPLGAAPIIMFCGPVSRKSYCTRTCFYFFPLALLCGSHVMIVFHLCTWIFIYYLPTGSLHWFDVGVCPVSVRC